MKRILTSVVLMALTQFAGAQCGCGSTAFNCTVSSGDTVCITPTFNSGTGKWDLSIAATADGGTTNLITVTIEAITNETVVGTVSISNTAGSTVVLEVTLKGTSGTTNLDSVDTIVQAEPATGIVTLFLLVTEEDVGSISVNRIGTANVGGNLTGNVVATTGNIGTLTVGGRQGGIEAPPCHRCAESSEHIGADEPSGGVARQWLGRAVPQAEPPVFAARRSPSHHAGR